MVSYSYDCYLSDTVISSDDTLRNNNCVGVMHKVFSLFKTAFTVFSVNCVIRITGRFQRNFARVYVYIHYTYSTCVFFFLQMKTRL